MIRAFRYPLRPTKDQEAALTAWLLACQQLYNGALQHRRDAWSRQRVSVTRYEQQCELTELRAADPEWELFLVAVRDKAESAGRWAVPVDSRGTSQTCPACGAVAKKSLGERIHRCPCGFSAHRDHAAAQVILGRGLRPVQLTEA